jgi:hypothetical protein
MKIKVSGVPYEVNMNHEIEAYEGELRELRAKNDIVNHPPHYKSGGVETIDFIEAKRLGYHLGNVVKYISRAGIKSHCPLEDLKKARWYLDRYITKMEEHNERV